MKHILVGREPNNKTATKNWNTDNSGAPCFVIL